MAALCFSLKLDLLICPTKNLSLSFLNSFALRLPNYLHKSVSFVVRERRKLLAGQGTRRSFK